MFRVFGTVTAAGLVGQGGFREEKILNRLKVFGFRESDSSSRGQTCIQSTCFSRGSHLYRSCSALRLATSFPTLKVFIANFSFGGLDVL